MAEQRLQFIIDAINRADATFKEVQTGVDKMKDKINNLQPVFRAMAAVGVAGFAAISGAAILSVKSFSEFNRTLNKIIGLVGINKEEIQKWEKSIQSLAVETGKSSIELADALYFITSAGLKGTDAIDALRVSAKAAAAGLGETKVVADLVTSAMNAYGVANLNAGKATDILVATVREGKAEPEDLAASMGMVLPIASELGVSFDQVGAAMAGMTRTGTNAATAATQLRQILASVLKPTKEANDTLIKFGTSASELRKKIREEGLLAVLLDLKDRFGDDEEAAARVFGNIRALAGVLDLLGANAEDNIAIFERMAESGGALDAAFQATEDATRAWKRLSVQFENIKIQIGGALAPALMQVVEKIKPILEKIAEWTEKNPMLTLAIVAISAALFGLMGFIGLLGMALPGLIILFGALSVSMIPITLAILGIITVIGLLIAIGWTLYKDWNLIKEGLKLYWEDIKKFFIDTWNSIKQYFTDTWEGIKTIVGEAIDWLMAKIQPFIDAFERVKAGAVWAGEQVGKGVSWIKRTFGGEQFGGEIPRTGRYLLHKGETVVPAGAGFGGGITVQILGGYFLSETVAEEIGDVVIEKIKRIMRI